MFSTDGSLGIAVRINNREARELSSNDKVYINGRLGETFTLALKNLLPIRIMVEVRIEGLSITDGLNVDEIGIGYILNPRSEVEIQNWRLHNGGNTPNFQFGMIPEGYEDTMDIPNGSGIIQARFFSEQAQPFYKSDYLSQMGIAIQKTHKQGWNAANKSRFVLEQFARMDEPLSELQLLTQISS